jgi:hypothetical protein
MSIAVSTAAQIASNHGVAAARILPGTKLPEDLIAEFQGTENAIA